MSGEFGSYNVSGYFWLQMEVAASDCKEGRDPLTKLWGEFLEEFVPIASSISWSEAGDSGPDDTIMNTIQRMGELKKRLQAIELFCRPYKDCMEKAVRDAVKK